MLRTHDAKPRPILVTGMPRSGTTWLARLLATASRTALTGREPMNPRGRQYALGGSLAGWACLDHATNRQRRALRTAYLGLNPWVYSRYGRRQAGALLPGWRNILKDPFAMLSMPLVAEVTGARPILLHRHPGATLASYRRMGWDPDTEELQPVIAAHNASRTQPIAAEQLPPVGTVSEPEAMARFWNALYTMALNDRDRTPGILIVSHPQIAGGGIQAGQLLFAELGLAWSDESMREISTRAPSSQVDENELHNFNRDPSEVANSWRTQLTRSEITMIEEITAPVRARLDAATFQLT